jgi:hypothetical protein
MKAGEMGRGGLSRAFQALMLCACLGIAGCAGAPRQHGAGQGRAVTGGSLSFALPPGATPNWLLPISLPGFTASFNGAIRAERVGLLFWTSARNADFPVLLGVVLVVGVATVVGALLADLAQLLLDPRVRIPARRARAGAMR